MSSWDLCLKKLAAMSFVVTLVCVNGISAQMTIFNVPSTDTLPKHSAYLEGDFVAKPVKNRDGGFQTYGYRVVYGLGHRTEIGSNFYYTRDASGSSTELQFSLKRNIYRNEKTGIAWSAGAIGSIPLHPEDGERSYGVFYTVASKTFESVNGLRLTGGAYTVAGGGDFGTRTGGIIGVEQPIGKGFSFVGDWSSGNNRFGYASAGLNYNITSRQFIMGGYSFGNYGRGNNFLSIFYGYTF